MNRVPLEWMIDGLQLSPRILALTLEGVTQEQARKIRDDAGGWNLVEMMCHLRDYQEIFFGRMKQVVEEDSPTFQLKDDAARAALVIDHDYANQEFHSVYDQYSATRDELIGFLSSLDEAQLKRLGHFPSIGEVDISFLIYHTIFHDAEHIEQFTRVLRQ